MKKILCVSLTTVLVFACLVAVSFACKTEQDPKREAQIEAANFVCNYNNRTVYSSLSQLEKEVRSGKETRAESYFELENLPRESEVREISINDYCTTITYFVKPDIVVENEPEINRLLSTVSLTWYYCDDTDATLENLVYTTGAQADQSESGLYTADVTRTIKDKDGKNHSVVVGEQLFWVQDEKVFTAYYPVDFEHTSPTLSLKQVHF